MHRLQYSRVFVDMDGVLADFEGGYAKLFGHAAANAESKKQMWKHIHSLPAFFEDLEVVSGAVDFMDWLHYRAEDEVMILTACPASEYESVAKQKRSWVRKHLGHTVVLPCYESKSKPLFMQKPKDILIDDYGVNCQAWEAAGGRAIKFEGDWQEVKEQLLDIWEEDLYGGNA